MSVPTLNRAVYNTDLFKQLLRDAQNDVLVNPDVVSEARGRLLGWLSMDLPNGATMKITPSNALLVITTETIKSKSDIQQLHRWLKMMVEFFGFGHSIATLEVHAGDRVSRILYGSYLECSLSEVNGNAAILPSEPYLEVRGNLTSLLTLATR